MTQKDTANGVLEPREWWKEAVVYQIYPRSFNDSDGDGIGDIPGIREKVDYLDHLGVDCVWLNPVYESPQVDNGYDVSDYRAINPEYGDMDDWERLLEELHDRDIRLVMDLVLNHTSDQHVWFQRSRDGDEEYADYYFWRDGRGGEGGGKESYPNNWESFFDTPAWSYDDEREQYYLHLFASAQPDLNWENPTVREELYETVNWWLEKGIDGFRLDVINLISKPEGLPNGDPQADTQVGIDQYVDGPRVHEYLDELAEHGFGDYREEVMSVGECVEIDPETALDVTGRKSNALDMTIFFEHVELDRDGWKYSEWNLTDLKTIMSKWQDAVEEGAWVSLYHSNHDQPRGLSRFGDPNYRYESATMLATWLHGHKGTPFVYQGEEIGMTNVDLDSPAELRDVWAQNYWDRKRNAGAEFSEVADRIERFGRDNARTPMQWTDGKHAGFTDGEPWIPVGDDYEECNVERERERDRSILEYYRELIDLRHDDDVLVYGDFELLSPDDEAIYAIRRTLPAADYELLICCNFTDGTPTFETPAEIDFDRAEVALSNELDPDRNPREVDLRPYEAAIYRLY
ncbi:glycoside hydrolase family 13 protein [Halalkaliarchaeum desulfuricum]|nr:alpha-glucosidase [Halalkaliarchaeum desulfuricum]